MGVPTRQGRVGGGWGRAHRSTFLVQSAVMAVKIAQVPASVVNFAYTSLALLRCKYDLMSTQDATCMGQKLDATCMHQNKCLRHRNHLLAYPTD